MRKRLIQAAWGAAMTCSQGRLYYDALKAKGRKHKEALVIMAKKLLSIMYTLIVHHKKFDYSKAFQAGGLTFQRRLPHEWLSLPQS